MPTDQIKSTLLWKNTWRLKMKKIALAAVFASAATTSFAGGLSQPEITMPPVEVIEPTAAGSSSGAGLIVPLILIALVAAALAD